MEIRKEAIDQVMVGILEYLKKIHNAGEHILAAYGSVEPEKSVSLIIDLEKGSNMTELVKKAGYDPSQFDLGEITKGYLVEQEHADVTKGDPVETMKIVMAHMTEVDNYYTKLSKMEKTK